MGAWPGTGGLQQSFCSCSVSAATLAPPLTLVGSFERTSLEARDAVAGRSTHTTDIATLEQWCASGELRPPQEDERGHFPLWGVASEMTGSGTAGM